MWFGFGSYPAEFDNLDEPDNIVFDSSGGTSQRCAKAPDYLFMDGFQPKVPSKPFLGYGELIEHLADKGHCYVLLWVMRSPRLRDRKGGTTEEQKWELYIPSGVKAENELFNGFGRRELLQSIAGSLFGGAVAAIIWLCSNNVAFTVVAALTGIFGSVMMCTKDQNNQSVVDQVGNMIRFARSQQIYPYRALSEWGT